MSLKIYHNPRCSKSRQTLALLVENGHDPEIILYLNDTPSEDVLSELVDKLGFLSARDLMRKGEAVYKELNLASVVDEGEMIRAMAKNPKLIERPIVALGGKAAIGRPPESVLALF